jgi:signal transduction histidine kinase
MDKTLEDSTKLSGNILIVDDTPANLHLLATLLQKRGCHPRAVPSGKLALQSARHNPPDLVLLDINMPEMDGYEVCTRLKSDETLAEIPVIFISALSETIDKIKAFSVGGVDYITKPFHFEEVEARVRTHLELTRQRKELRDNYRRLRELEALRDGMSQMIVHDIRSPLTAILGNLELIELCELDKMSPAGCNYVVQGKNAAKMIIELVSDILDVGKMEAGNMKLKLSLCNPGDLFRNSIAIVESLKGQRQLSLDALGAEMDLQCDVELINRVLYNLLGNAIKFTTKTGTIRCGVEAGPKWVKFSISDDGSGIPIEYHKKIFEKYGQVEAYENQRKYSTGLGLTFCKMAVEAHGGQIGLESEVDKGSTFWFILPVSSIIQ